MRRHLKYLSYVLRHKLFVFFECFFRYGLIWQGLIHDWHKFLPSEWSGYVTRFGGDDGGKSGRDKTGYYDPSKIENPEFSFSLFLHIRRGMHHWQWWIEPRVDENGNQVLVMKDIPIKYRKEMICDWHGAGRAQGKDDVLGFYQANKDKMLLHPDTRSWIEKEIGYDVP